MIDSLEGGVRVAGGLHIHGTTDFRTLCDEVITDETRYLVLDLDKTIHLGHNVGELLGWELSALEAYGEPYLEEIARRTDRNRGYLYRGQPLKSFRYLLVALQRWAMPGLFYYVFVRLAAKSPALRRRVFRWFGLEPVDAVQSVVRNALFRQLSNIPLETAREIVRQVWRRLEPDQVIHGDDIAYLKSKYPQLHVVLSSASPQPVLEVAREKLGVDAVFYTEVEEHEGYLSLPHEIGCDQSSPRRLSPPSKTIHNASVRKIERLRETYPDMFSGELDTVGITDTSYGEDHVWAHHFRKVVDINSPTPFTPIVPASSPIGEIHSADVLTTEEKQRRAGSEPDYLDPRRKKAAGKRKHFSAQELQELLKAPVETLRTLTAVYQKRLEASMRAKTQLVASMRELVRDAEVEVDIYNRSLGAARKEALKRIRRGMRSVRKVRRKIVSLEKPLADAAYRMSHTLEQARATLPHERKHQ